MPRLLPVLNAARPGIALRRGFSLVELLVAMAVLAILVALMAQMVGSATSTLLGSRRRIEADAQARMVFDRMSLDLARMVRRADADVVFAKNDGAEHNDAFYFLSEAPAFSDDPATTAAASTLALTGYRITPAPLLERLGKRLAADGPDSAAYLARVAGSDSFAPDPASTLAGRWPATLGAEPAYTTGTDAAYQTLGPLALRMEFCFLLADGTFSDKPVIAASGVGNNLSAAAAPTPADDGSAGKGFAVGSRWFDTQSRRGYICANAAPGAAVWQPLGTRDVAAIVVAIVVLDSKSRQLAESAGGLAGIGAAFSDVTASDLTAAGPVLMLEKWSRELAAADFATRAGVPQAVAAQLRVYQSFFYLNPRPSHR